MIRVGFARDTNGNARATTKKSPEIPIFIEFERNEMRKRRTLAGQHSVNLTESDVSE
ncbi:MAG: hypothetical protein ABL952_14840 [Pyrinomonadaceae bacterium]